MSAEDRSHRFIGESCTECGIPYEGSAGYVIGGICQGPKPRIEVEPCGTDRWFAGRFDALIAGLQDRADFPITTQADKWLYQESARQLSALRTRLFGASR